MQEVVGRRYARLIEDKKPLPDLIIVDGGKGQLSHAYDVLKDLGMADVPVIGLAKRLEEVFVVGSSEPLILPKTSSSLRLLQQLRDEAHRFAISYHRTLREKRTLQTELTEIRGVGSKTAEKLLERFGSVEGLKRASEVEIIDAVGLKVARKIKEHFQETEALAQKKLADTD
jgi:excinuclease ABC subunit C